MIKSSRVDRTVTAFSAELCITRQSMSEVINRRTSVSPEMALCLEKVFPGATT